MAHKECDMDFPNLGDFPYLEDDFRSSSPEPETVVGPVATRSKTNDESLDTHFKLTKEVCQQLLVKLGTIDASKQTKEKLIKAPQVENTTKSERCMTPKPPMENASVERLKEKLKTVVKMNEDWQNYNKYNSRKMAMLKDANEKLEKTIRLERQQKRVQIDQLKEEIAVRDQQIDLIKDDYAAKCQQVTLMESELVKSQQRASRLKKDLELEATRTQQYRERIDTIRRSLNGLDFPDTSGRKPGRHSPIQG